MKNRFRIERIKKRCKMALNEGFISKPDLVELFSIDDKSIDALMDLWKKLSLNNYKEYLVYELVKNEFVYKDDHYDRKKLMHSWKDLKDIWHWALFPFSDFARSDLFFDVFKEIIDHGLLFDLYMRINKKYLLFDFDKKPDEYIIYIKIENLYDWIEKLKNVHLVNITFPKLLLNDDLHNIEDASKILQSSKSFDNVFKQDGQLWTIVYDGKKVHFPNLKALKEIQYLIANPNTLVTYYDLLRLDLGDVIDNVSRKQDVIHDAKYLSDYKKERHRLKQQLDKSELAGDSYEINEATTKLKKLDKHMFTWFGKSKSFTDEITNQVLALKKRIIRTIKMITKNHKKCGEHLEKCIIFKKKNEGILYTPGDGIKWKIK